MSKFTFDGVLIEDLEIRRGFAIPTWSYHEITATVIPGRHGSLPTGSRLRSRLIPVPVQLKFTDETDLKEKKEKITSLLVTKQAKKLTFDIEPGRVFHGMIEGALTFNERELNVAMETINFICHNPFKHAPEPTSIQGLTVNNTGSTEAFPVFRITNIGNASDFIIYHTQSDKYIRVIWNFNNNHVLEIDTSIPEIRIDGNVQMTSLAWITSEWFELEPGINTFEISSGSLTTEFTPRWL